MLEDNPIVKKVGLGMLLFSLLASVGGVWWYLQSDEIRNAQWFEDDQRWNGQIIEGITLMAKEQAEQRVLIDDMVARQAQQFLQMESSFEELEEEHQFLVRAVYEGLVDISYRVGIHEGAHDQLESSIGQVIDDLMEHLESHATP